MPAFPPATAEEIPPTAGLPLGLADLLPGGPRDLAGALARWLQAPGAGLECSGTASLVVILTTLRQRSSRRTVIVPAYTCPLVVFAVAHCGLRLRLCDLAADSFALDTAALARLCDADTLAVIPTHLGGRVADLGPILDLAARCGCAVIEDAAQALGARSGGQSVGLAGDAGFFSLAAGKGLSLYEGGLWVSRHPDLALALARTSRAIIPRGLAWELRRCIELLGYLACYRPRPLRAVYGAPLRRALAADDPVAAAGDEFAPRPPLHRVSAWRQRIGCRALARLPDFQGRLAAQARPRLQQLARLPGIKVFADGPGVEGTWPLLLALLPTPQQRDAALAELWGAGLGVARMFALALPDYAYLRPWVAPADCPRARDFAARSLTLSNSLWLDEERFAAILAILARHLA